MTSLPSDQTRLSEEHLSRLLRWAEMQSGYEAHSAAAVHGRVARALRELQQRRAADVGRQASACPTCAEWAKERDRIRADYDRMAAALRARDAQDVTRLREAFMAGADSPTRPRGESLEQCFLRWLSAPMSEVPWAFCSECGPVHRVDEDGCCPGCGNGALLSEHARKRLAQLMGLEAALSAPPRPAEGPQKE